MEDDEGVVTLFSYGLLHKFGFEDGDVMYQVISEHDLDVDFHDLLIAVVERLVVPRLDQKVETYTIYATLHNPIRAKTIDGEEADMSDELTPEQFDIPVGEILAIAADLPPSRY